MDPADAGLQQGSLRAETEFFGLSADTSRLLESAGMLASIVPDAPDQQIVNQVTYSWRIPPPTSQIRKLARCYLEAGVRRWAVWVPTADTVTGARLDEAGYVSSDSLPGMTLDLSTWQPGDPWPGASRTGDLPILAATFADAQEGTGEGIRAALRTVPVEMRDRVRIYHALGGDAVACSLATIDTGTDCGVYWVGTVPAWRRRRIATRLLTNALLAARERGCTTSTLQASAMGAPVYLHMGYRQTCTMGLFLPPTVSADH